MEVSILLLTYNHEKFVRQALDSIIGQQINVSYEILILDDASSDNTPQILADYKKKYPGLISLYLRKVNSCHPTRNVYFLISKARGKYLAVIEGDDYWIDDMKIQKQYDFMETHKWYSACVSDLIVVDENGKENKERQVYEKKKNHIYTMEDFKHLKMPGRVVSIFARNYFNKTDFSILYRADKVMGDISFFMLCVMQGPIYQLGEKMAAYRYVSVAGENNFNSIHKEDIYKEYNIMRYWIKMENFMKKNYKQDFEIVPIKDALKEYSPKYSVKSMLYLISESKNREKYFAIYMADKYLLDSKFVLESGEKEWKYHGNSWIKYKYERKPVILFGAGNVAEEYIRKYAWQGDILFLVDNDANKQNRSFKGFLVKKPEEILHYKDNAKILITNKDHEEAIGHQLQAMGIGTYYCYCSMQSGRLKHIIANRILI